CDLNLLRGHHTPAAVRGPVRSVLTNPGDIADSTHRGFEAEKLGGDSDFGRLRNVQHRIEVSSVCPVFLEICRSLAVKEAPGPREVVILQPRDLDRTRRACLSSKRAKASSKCANAVAQTCTRPGTAARPRRELEEPSDQNAIVNRLSRSWDRTA